MRRCYSSWGRKFIFVQHNTSQDKARRVKTNLRRGKTKKTDQDGYNTHVLVHFFSACGRLNPRYARFLSPTYDSLHSSQTVGPTACGKDMAERQGNPRNATNHADAYGRKPSPIGRCAWSTHVSTPFATIRPYQCTANY